MKALWIISSIALAYILGLFTQCNKPCPPCNELVRTEKEYDTLIKVVTEKVPVPYRVEKYVTIWDTLRNPKLSEFEGFKIDCSDIVHYSDTFGDSTYWIRLTESVSQNRIASRTLLYRNLRPTVINHYSPPEKWNLYAGAYYSQTVGISASVTFKGWQYEAGIDLNKKPMVGVKRKIF